MDAARSRPGRITSEVVFNTPQITGGGRTIALGLISGPIAPSPAAAVGAS